MGERKTGWLPAQDDRREEHRAQRLPGNQVMVTKVVSTGNLFSRSLLRGRKVSGQIGGVAPVSGQFPDNFDNHDFEEAWNRCNLLI